MLDTVVSKMNKKQSWNHSVKEVDEILVSFGGERLRESGVFRTSFGAKYVPIILTNPAFAKALKASTECTCGISKDYASDKVRLNINSQAYDSGKHNAGASPHKINCAEWTPPKASHLHSWRRGYADVGKK